MIAVYCLTFVVPIDFSSSAITCRRPSSPVEAGQTSMQADL
jgi:hypothetical protein